MERNKFERKFDIFGIKSEEVLFLCQIHQERGRKGGGVCQRERKEFTVCRGLPWLEVTVGRRLPWAGVILALGYRR